MASFKRRKIIAIMFSASLLLTLFTTGCLHDKAKNKAESGLNETRKSEKDVSGKTPSKTSKKEEAKTKSSRNKGLKEADGKQFGFIKRIEILSGKDYLVIDYAQMLTGAAAETAAGAAGEEVNNDYYIKNVNPRLRTIEIAKSVVITMQTWQMTSTGKVGDSNISYAKFNNIFSAIDDESKRMAASPYWITISGAKIIKIKEQYLP